MTLPALTELTQMDRPALALRWESTFGVHAPKGCQATLLRQALAWQVQMTALKTGSGLGKPIAVCGRCRHPHRRLPSPQGPGCCASGRAAPTMWWQSPVDLNTTAVSGAA